MVKMTLKQSSCPADESCVVYCNREANLVLNCSETLLFRVTTTDGLYHFVWRDKDSADEEFPEFCPIFREDDEDEICEITDVQQIQVNEIFCHDGEAYYLEQNNRGTLTVRRLNTYTSQEIVEKIAWYDDNPEPVTKVELIKLYDLRGGKHFVMYCWQLSREHSTEFMPIFDGEDQLFNELFFPLTQKEAVPVGSSICHQKKSYVLYQDFRGKLYLGLTDVQQNLSALQKLGYDDIPEQNDEEDARSQTRIVRLIPLHK